MGLFSSLFGNGGSDKADKMRQAALDAFNSIQTPALKDLQVQLSQYVQAGRLTPEQAETQLLSSNAFNSIVTDPSYVGAQKQALQQMQDIATQGGLTAIDKSRLNDITNQQNQQNKSQNAATMQQAQQRGVGGSDLNTVNQLINEQGSADRAANQGIGVAASAQQRALQAMQAAGQQGGQLESQAYGEQANKAQAANAIDVFNKNTLNQQNLYNTQTSNAAQAANLANAQAVANANTGTSNANKEYNAAAVQQQYDDAMRKAQGVAGQYTSWANDAAKKAEDERNASAGLITGGLQAGATALGGAMGGPAGASAGSNMAPHAPPSYAPKNESEIGYGFSDGGEVPLPITWDEENQKWNLADKDHQPIGSFSDYPSAVAYAEKVKSKEPAQPDHMACGGSVSMGYAKGKVPGKANVPGDSPKNDIVDAKLSPGEIVVPRSASNDDAEFEAFMAKFKPSAQKKKHEMADGGMVIPRVNETNPMRDTTHSSPTNPVPLAAVNDSNDYSQMMHKFKPPKKAKAPPRVSPEANALASLHTRISKLEGRPI